MILSILSNFKVVNDCHRSLMKIALRYRPTFQKGLLHSSHSRGTYAEMTMTTSVFYIEITLRMWPIECGFDHKELRC